MNKVDDILMEEVKQEIADIQCPKQVDVVNAVMDSIKDKQLLVPSTTRRTWVNVASGLAACLVIALIVNLSLFLSHPYNEQDLNKMFAELDQYTFDYSTPDAFSEDYTNHFDVYFEE